VVISNDPYAPVTIGPGEVVPTDQPTAPYLDAVVAYGFRGSTRFHVPGHLGGDPLARQQRRDPRRVARDRLGRDAADRVGDRDRLRRPEERGARRGGPPARGGRPHVPHDRGARRLAAFSAVGEGMVFLL